MPCKGDETGLERNLNAALQQEYANYRTVIVTDSTEDPAYAVAKSALSRQLEGNSRLYTSDTAVSASGKVAALLTAVGTRPGAS